MQRPRFWTRGAILAVAALSMLLGVFTGGLFTGDHGAGSRASAQEPAFVLYGFIIGGEGPLPSRIRATVGSVVCGSGQVYPGGNEVGVYALTVVSNEQKAGCGTSGVAVRLTLLASEIDPGVVAGQVVWRPGQSQRFDLSTQAQAPDGGSFSGVLPVGQGVAYLRWTGASATPIERAVSTIPRTVTAVYFWNVQRQRFDSYIPGAPNPTYTLVDTDDIVMVQVQ